MVQFHVKYLIFKVPILCPFLRFGVLASQHLLIDVLPRSSSSSLLSFSVYVISHFSRA